MVLLGRGGDVIGVGCLIGEGCGLIGVGCLIGEGVVLLWEGEEPKKTK